MHCTCNLEELVQQYKNEAHGVDLTSDESDPTSVDVFDRAHLKKATEAKPSLSGSTQGDLVVNSDSHIPQKHKQKPRPPCSYRFPPGNGGTQKTEVHGGDVFPCFKALL